MAIIQSSLPFGEVENKQSTIEVNIKDKYWLFKLLLDGNYIMEKKNRSDVYRYCVYQGDRIPIKLVKVKDVIKIIKLLRKNKELYLLDKRKVRKLHGKTNYKKLYKQHLKSKQNGN